MLGSELCLLDNFSSKIFKFKICIKKEFDYFRLIENLILLFFFKCYLNDK